MTATQEQTRSLFWPEPGTRWWRPEGVPGEGVPDCPVCGARGTHHRSGGPGTRVTSSSRACAAWCREAQRAIWEAEVALLEHRAWTARRRRLGRWT